jgi:myo-inositol-1(or 4)-monophosphatase
MTGHKDRTVRGPHFWLEVFRDVGIKAQKVSQQIWGTPEAQKELGRGACGDRTVEMDRRLEDILIDKLKRVGDIRLISEESGLLEFGEPNATIIADPLDGSFNAKMGIPLFTISLALVEGDLRMGNITLGYIRNLLTGKEYIGITGKGATFDGTPLETSNRTDVTVIGMECHPNTVLALRQSLTVVDNDTRFRSLGCASMDLCLVAKGVFDTVIDVRERRSRIIDIAAGYRIVLEAGGMMTDEEGRPLDDIKVEMSTRINFVASGNLVVHKKVLRMLEEQGYS